MKKLRILLSLSACCMASYADDSVSTNSSGAYLNINTGFASMQALPTGGWTGNLNAGYNFNQAFALEGGYNVFASSQYGATAVSNIFDVAAKGTIPLSDIFNLYGRLGVGLGYNSTNGVADAGCSMCQATNNSYALGLAGVGVSFALSKHFDLRLEDTMYVPINSNNFNGSSINAVTFGTQYNF